MPKVISLSAHPVALPLKEPFTTAKGRATQSFTVIIEVELDTGAHGLGEATPKQYVTGETFRSMAPAIRSATDAVLGADPNDWREISLLLEKELPQAVAARAGIETALLDAAARIASQPLYEFLGGTKAVFPTDQTISVVRPDRAAQIAADAWRGGIRRLKIKADGGPEDIPRILAAQRAAPHADLKVDANQAFTPEGAISFVESLEKAGVRLSLLEQPVAKDDIDGLRYVTENVPVPVFADESALSPDDVKRLADARAVKGVNVKLMKSGSRGALEIIDICRQAGLSLMLGCMLESRVGISAALHLACATQAFDHFDLDSDLLIASQPVTGGFERRGDQLEVGDAPGLGCVLTL